MVIYLEYYLILETEESKCCQQQLTTDMHAGAYQSQSISQQVVVIHDARYALQESY